MGIPPRAQKFRQDRPIVDPKTGYPTPEFLRNINSGLDLLNYLADIQAAADAAQQAADNANTAAQNAQNAADAAQGAANGAADATALANSYPTGVTISANDVGGGTSSTVFITAHTRVYATDPQTSVSVNAGSIPGLVPDTRYYIYYDQPSRSGGTVSYAATTNQSNVAQVNNRHSVGTVKTPVASGGPTNGGGTTPPGGNYEQEP